MKENSKKFNFHYLGFIMCGTQIIATKVCKMLYEYKLNRPHTDIFVKFCELLSDI